MKVIKIGAIWCPACLFMNMRFQKIAKNYNLEIIDYDYDIDSDIIKKYELGKTLPVSIFIDAEGKELTRLVGEVSEKKIIELIEELESRKP